MLIRNQEGRLPVGDPGSMEIRMSVVSGTLSVGE